MATPTLFINKFKPIFLKDFESCADLIGAIKTVMSLDILNILLVGNSGSGKTVMLDAIIREYYSDISTNTDNILHINSLKEQGVQYYRGEVKTFCQTRCSIKDRKKIIVLDDIDMIPEQSQQIFRNCMDKYSKNVHFISSCSNTQKVIESLQSRFTLMQIHNLEISDISKILMRIKESEMIQLDREAEEYILNICNKSVKTLINYMEKCKLLNCIITIEIAMQLCTDISTIWFEEFTQNILSKNLPDSIRNLYDIHDKGYSVIDILDNYFIFIKSTAILSEDIKYKFIPIICKYITIFNNIHEEEIELSLFSNNLISSL